MIPLIVTSLTMVGAGSSELDSDSELSSLDCSLLCSLDCSLLSVDVVSLDGAGATLLCSEVLPSAQAPNVSAQRASHNKILLFINNLL